jgi:hypothetical protein
MVSPVIVVDAADVEQRNRFQTSAATELETALIRTVHCSAIADDAIGHVIEVLVVTADLFVQVKKLVLGNDAGVQRLQPVLHSNVVEGAKGEACGRVDAVHVVSGVIDRGSGAPRICDRIVP